MYCHIIHFQSWISANSSVNNSKFWNILGIKLLINQTLGIKLFGYQTLWQKWQTFNWQRSIYIISQGKRLRHGNDKEGESRNLCDFRNGSIEWRTQWIHHITQISINVGVKQSDVHRRNIEARDLCFGKFSSLT